MMPIGLFDSGAQASGKVLAMTTTSHFRGAQATTPAIGTASAIAAIAVLSCSGNAQANPFDSDGNYLLFFLLELLLLGPVFFAIGWFRWWLAVLIPIVGLVAAWQRNSLGGLEGGVPDPLWLLQLLSGSWVPFLALVAGAIVGRRYGRPAPSPAMGTPAVGLSVRAGFASFRSIQPRGRDAIRGFVAAMLYGGGAGILVMTALPLFIAKAPTLTAESLLFSLPIAVSAYFVYGVLSAVPAAATVFFGGFFALRGFRILNLWSFTLLGLVAGLVNGAPWFGAGITAMFAAAYGIGGVIGGIAGFRELHRQVMLGNVAQPTDASIRLFRAIAKGLQAGWARVIRFASAVYRSIASVYHRVARVAAGTPRRMQVLVAISWAAMGAIAGFVPVRASSLVVAGAYPAVEVLPLPLALASGGALLFCLIGGALLTRIPAQVRGSFIVASCVAATAAAILVRPIVFGD